MSESAFIRPEPLPFCAGCGHHLVARSTARALARIGLKPLSVVLVTDIGCHGIVDQFFLTHTVHGLHGRAAALGAGIAAGLSQGKVIVFMGDGGASIGLQHLVECARRNFPLSVVVHNNMLYGMTGGQPSALTPCGFRTPLIPEGKPDPGLDLCRVIRAAGAPYVQRVASSANLPEALAEAFVTPGFSLVEVIETCPSYGLKYNPDKKPEAIAEQAGFEFGTWRNQVEQPVFRLHPDPGRPSLFTDLGSTPEKKFSPPENFSRTAVLIAGSAGGGVQQTAEALAAAAIAAGIYATKKGTYPVTVGTGYSVAEVILSPDPILFTGIDKPDVAIIVSPDGLRYAEKTVRRMDAGLLVIDSALPLPESGANVLRQPFGKIAGNKNAALLALLFLLQTTNLLPPAALIEQLKATSRGRRDSLPKLLDQLATLTTTSPVDNYKNKPKEE